MSTHTAILCPHGKATCWTSEITPDDLGSLPDCEHCEECNPGAVELEVSR